MIEVRIRHQDEADAVRLTDVPFNDIGSVIPAVKGWGIADYEDRELSAQFVVTDTAAYFEVVIVDSDS
jgi:hypothetical protein